MIKIDVQQGTPEWLLLHCGIPTASRFEKLITPKKHEPSKAMEGFVVELVAELQLGYPFSFAGNNSDWMERGSGLESEARRWYSFTQEVEVEEVGFCLTDDRRAGCSPDGLVGEDGLLEIKCPSAHVHLGHLLGRTDPVTDTQAQGQLYVTGRQWVDCLSYCPGMPPVLIRVRRDEALIDALAHAVDKLHQGIEATLRRLAGMGVIGRIEGFGDQDNDALRSDLFASVQGA